MRRTSTLKNLKEISIGQIWYLDNGANNHMTGKRDYFKTINETITGKVRFGDDSRIDIKGKGFFYQSKQGKEGASRCLLYARS